MPLSAPKKLAVLSIAVFLAVSAAAAQVPATGWYTDAVTANPGARSFSISTADELAGLAEIVNGTWGGSPSSDSFAGKTITLTGDIDLSAYDNWVPIGHYNTSTFIIRPFSGTFYGFGYVISNLSINRPNENNQGLFGYVSGGRIEDLRLENVDVSGGWGVGGLGGLVRDYSYVVNCYVNGTVSGTGWGIGGLVGSLQGSVMAGVPNWSHVINSSSSAEVTGPESVGGVAGNLFAGSVSGSYSTGAISGGMRIGGVVGRVDAHSRVTGSYSTGAVSGTDMVGGVAGSVGYGSVTNSAALNPYVRGLANAGRVIGNFGYPVLSNNVAFSGITNNSGSTAWLNLRADGLDGADITACDINTDGTVAGLFVDADVWTTQNGRLPGFLGKTVAMPEHLNVDGGCDVVVDGCAETAYNWYAANLGATSFTISNACELAGLAEIVNGTWGGAPSRDDFSGKTITLAGDIDLSGYDNWVSIGRLYDIISARSDPFSGTFDGGGHVISNLTINRPGTDYQGLFGYIKGGRVENLGLDNVNILGGNYVGGVAGKINDYSRVTNCYSIGTVSGTDFVAGVVGGVLSNIVDVKLPNGYDSHITVCYFTGVVKGRDFVGGVVGGMYGGTVTNSYSAGTVSGNNFVGGVVGRTGARSILTYSYSTSAVSGRELVGGVTGFALYNELANNAALNPEVKGVRNIGRVVGQIYEGTTVPSNNVAFSGITNNSGSTAWLNLGADGLDGADITACEINTNGTIAGLFVDADVWTTQNGKLPGLFGETATMPEHLNVDGGCDVVVDGCADIAYDWYAANLGATSFTISNACELAGLAEIVNGTWGGAPSRDDFSGKTITLAGNIDLSGYDNWVPIGRSVPQGPATAYNFKKFSGTFDGAGYVISNLTINRPDAADIQGLFGYVSGGRVENLGVENVNIIGNASVGAIAAWLRDEGRMTNCYATGTVRGPEFVGGLVGMLVGNDNREAFHSRMTNCYFIGDVSTSGGFGGVGGVVGGMYAGTIANSYSAGTVVGPFANGNQWVAGGVAGRVEANSTVINCYSTSTVIGMNMVGGVAGGVGYNSKIINSAALNSEVSGRTEKVGRVAGSLYHQSTISNSVAFIGIKNNAGNTAWTNLGTNGLDGADITACEINTNGTIAELFIDADIWTTKNGDLPGLFGKTAAMPEHLAPPLGCVISRDTVVVDTVVIDSVKVKKSGLTAGPNPVSRRTGPLKFYRDGAQIADAVLTIFDASGNVVAAVRISDNSGNQDRRLVGSWNLMSAKGGPVSEGAYLIKGVIVTLDGKRERISIIVGVR